ncbi:MAG: FAD-dependent monooxygenase, partial [Planctomycetes bacterium]|nr:FAD-dependent monooxygenase [Planctomycetota bacterium]
ELVSYTIVRKAIDARKKNRILTVYTIDVEVASAMDEGRGTKDEGINYQSPIVNRQSSIPPVIVGSGPCGLMAALLLAQAGAKPVLIERGKDVVSRVKDVQAFWKNGVLNPESNVPFGEGGAGTFSDGKLTTQIKDKHNRVRKVLDEFVAAGAPDEILYQAKPHIGTDNLVRVVKHIREKIIELGGQVRFETMLTGITVKDGRIVGAVVNDGETIATDTLILALGHSARDTFEMLGAAGVAMEAKPFSVGVRIEHPQTLIDTAQYGKFAGHPKLGPADYKLVHHSENGRSAYTFCMCPGGEVIGSSSEPGGGVTHGMSIYRPNPTNAHSAPLGGITPADFSRTRPPAGITF